MIQALQVPLAAILGMLPLFTALVEGLDPDSVARYGLLGAVLGWFMLRADKRLAGIEHKMGGLQRTMLLEILSRPTTSVRARQLCQEELRKVAPELAEDVPTAS
jgi:hypothetical protein